jgi:predicted PurR-regulated permease PerM
MEDPVGTLATSDAGVAAEPTRHDRRLRPPTLRVAVLLAAGIILATILYLGREALGPFVLGLFLVYLLDPLVSLLGRRFRLPRWLGVLATYAAIVGVLALVVRVTVPPLVEQVKRLIDELPALLQVWIDALERTIADLDLLPATVREELIRTLEEYQALLIGGAGSIDWSGIADLLPWGSLASPVARIVTAFFAYLVIPIFVFYLLKDRPALVRAVETSVPREWRPDLGAVASIVDRVFGRWVRGQLLLGFVVGLATFVGLELLALTIDPVFADFAIILAILAGLLELVPIIGPIIAAIPLILIGATAGIEGVIAAFLLALVIQQVENNFLVPKIQGDATDLHPSIVIAGIVIGGSIGGILGAILALPATAAFRDVVRYLFVRTGPDPIAVDAALEMALQPAQWRAAMDPEPPDAGPPGPAAAGDAALDMAGRASGSGGPPSDAVADGPFGDEPAG